MGTRLSWFGMIAQRIEQANKILVASAGNGGTGGSDLDDPFTVTSPASNPHAIGVGGTTPDKTLYQATSEGPGDFGIMKPDLVAQATNVLVASKEGDYFYWEGTSFAAPTVAGSIATLISALEANNVNWTVATLKAALMRTATDLDYPNYQQGTGLINVSRAFDYLMSLPKDQEGIPIVFEVTPKEGYPPELNSIPIGRDLHFPVTVITSHLENVSFELQGNFTSFASIDVPMVQNFSSHEITIHITPNGSQSVGYYSGELRVSFNNETMHVPISFNVLSEPAKKIYVDGYHTVLDDVGGFGLASDLTGALSSILLQDGYWLEIKNEPFSLETLSQFDALLMISPFKENGYTGFVPNPITDTELKVLFEYLEQGGSLFLTGDSVENGSHISQLEKISKPFGVTFTSTVPDDQLILKRIARFAFNETSINRNADAIQVFYGSLNVESPGRPLAIDENGYVSLAYGVTSNYAGRVVFSATTHFFQIEYLDRDVKFPHSTEFIQDLFDFLTSKERISVVNETITENQVNLVVRSMQNGTFSEVDPKIKLRVGNEEAFNYTIEYLGQGFSEIRLLFLEDGLFEPVMSFGNDYVARQYIIDTAPPHLRSDDRNPSKISSDRDIAVLNFFAEDESGIDWNSLDVTLDGKSDGFNVFSSSSRITVSFAPRSLLPLETHTIKIELSDLFGNEGNLSYSFFVSGRIEETSSSIEETTPNDTETMESQISSSVRDVPFAETSMIFMLAILMGKRRKVLFRS